MQAFQRHNYSFSFSHLNTIIEFKTYRMHVSKGTCFTHRTDTIQTKNYNSSFRPTLRTLHSTTMINVDEYNLYSVVNYFILQNEANQ